MCSNSLIFSPAVSELLLVPSVMDYLDACLLSRVWLCNPVDLSLLDSSALGIPQQY